MGEAMEDATFFNIIGGSDNQNEHFNKYSLLDYNRSLSNINLFYMETFTCLSMNILLSSYI